MEKNRNSFSQDLKVLIQNCTNQYLCKLFENDLKPNNSNNKRDVTLASQFRTSLDVLMKTLNSCRPYFIRCIKPNERKQAKVLIIKIIFCLLLISQFLFLQLFDRDLCFRQLRYSGMMETARIRQAGYPIRYTYMEFFQRYRYIDKSITVDDKAEAKKATEKICAAILNKNKDYQFGLTKIFLKEVQYNCLETERNRIVQQNVLILQKVIKGWIIRRKFLRLKAAAVIFQRHFRSRGYRSCYLATRTGYRRLQAVIRSRRETYSFAKLKIAAIGLQAYCKGYFVRNKHQFGKIINIVSLKSIEEKELKKAGEKNYKFIAETNMKKRLMEVDKEYTLKEREIKEDVDTNALELIESEFDFLGKLSFPSDNKNNNKELMVRTYL